MKFCSFTDSWISILSSTNFNRSIILRGKDNKNSFRRQVTRIDISPRRRISFQLFYWNISKFCSSPIALYVKIRPLSRYFSSLRKKHLMTKSHHFRVTRDETNSFSRILLKYMKQSKKFAYLKSLDQKYLKNRIFHFILSFHSIHYYGIYKLELRSLDLGSESRTTKSKEEYV